MGMGVRTGLDPTSLSDAARLEDSLFKCRARVLCRDSFKGIEKARSFNYLQ
jgi:hypothetical protein